MILRNETKEDYEFDRGRVLALWPVLLDAIPEGDDRGYIEYDGLDDDGRIIAAFELLNGSVFGDMIFGSLANFDQGSTLREDVER
jgi:hypothetical protein